MFERDVLGAEDKKTISRRCFLKLASATLAIPSLYKLPLLKAFFPEIVMTENQKILPFQSISGVLHSKNMPVLLFPLKSDYMFDFWKDSKCTSPSTIENFYINSFPLGFKNIYKQSDGEKYVHYTILPHTTGSKVIPVALVDRGTLKGGEIFQTEKYYTEISEYPKDYKNGTEHTVWGEYYPNKIKNVLTALMAIDDFQQANGSFENGQEYSLIEILKLKQRSDYVEGKTSSGSLVTGGGVCLIATNICKVVREANAEILERWQHPTGQRYWTGPEAGEILSQRNSDATIEIGSSEVFDLRWKQNKNSWLKIDAQVIPNGKKVISELGDESQKSDAYILITMNFVDKNPGPQSVRIKTIREAYIHYRADPSVNLSELSRGSKYLNEIPWSRGDKNEKLLSSISPEEKRMNFDKELTTNPYLENILVLQLLLNSYTPRSNNKDGVGTYLKGSSWYEKQRSMFYSQSDLSNFEASLRMLDYSTDLVKNQPIQCVGYAALLANLPGQLNFKSIGGLNITNAAQLVPSEIKSGEKTVISKNELTFLSVKTLGEIRPGDLFVEYGNGAGHVGCVIEKKDINGKIVILLTDANRTNDGRVRIFEVDDNNFDVALGPYPYKKVIIR